jgi:hypothetical protein
MGPLLICDISLEKTDANLQRLAQRSSNTQLPNWESRFDPTGVKCSVEKNHHRRASWFSARDHLQHNRSTRNDYTGVSPFSHRSTQRSCPRALCLFLTFVGYLVVFLIIKRIYYELTSGAARRAIIKRHGCEPVHHWQHRAFGKLFGLDLVQQQYKDDKAVRTCEEAIQRFSMD